MPDDRDYSEDPPRRRPSREPLESGRQDDWDDSYARRSVPSLVRTAGFIWIIFGSLSILGAASNLVMAGATNGGNLGSVGCGALFGIAFIFVGVQSLNGTAKDTLGNSIGSIVIGVLYCGIGALAFLGGAIFSSGTVAAQPQQRLALVVLIIGGVSLLVGLGLILAGVLALMGRADYKAYLRGGKRYAPSDD